MKLILYLLPALTLLGCWNEMRVRFDEMSKEPIVSLCGDSLVVSTGNSNYNSSFSIDTIIIDVSIDRRRVTLRGHQRIGAPYRTRFRFDRKEYFDETIPLKNYRWVWEDGDGTLTGVMVDVGGDFCEANDGRE